MKKILLVFVSFVAFGLTTVSCSKSDSETSIEGKWVYSKLGIGAQGQEVLQDYPNTATCEKNFDTYSGSSIKNTEFRKINGVCTPTEETGTFTRNGDKLTVTFGTEVETATILSLTDSELKISTPTEQDGINAIIVFTKG